MNWRTAITIIASLILGLYLVAYQSPKDLSTEIFINMNTIIFPLCIFLILAFAIELILYPADKAEEVEILNRSKYDALEGKISELTSQLGSKEKLLECGERLSELVIKARDILKNNRATINQWQTWHGDVCSILVAGYPGAKPGFHAVQARFDPDAFKDILREEVRKIDGGILPDIRRFTQ